MTDLAWNLARADEDSQPEHAEAGAGSGPFFAIFDALEAAGIDYCVSHGAEEFPWPQGSDIDMVVQRGVSDQRLEAAVRQACDGKSVILGAKSRGSFAVAIRDAGSATRVVHLDFARDCEAQGRIVQHGEAMLAGKRRVGRVFAPDAATDFNAYLARCVLKGCFDERRRNRLASLWHEDPQGCANGLDRLFGDAAARQIATAFDSGDPAAIFTRTKELRRLVEAVTHRAGVLAAMPRSVTRALRLAKGLLFPKGLSVVMLGPDGAGKSSNIEVLEKGLGGLFPKVDVRGFAPPLHRMVKRGPKRTDTPHALPPRSLLVSVLRACYWFVYDNWGRLPVRLVKARGGLVLFDRHLIDILIDPVRYRYGGPRFVLDLLARLTPKPDLVILLHAPGEVLHARKPEMTLAETKRQARAYLDLVRALPNGHVVDASQGFEKVSRDIEDILLDARARR